MGRRATKKVATNGETMLHQRYLYRGYLQIAACDLTDSAQPCLWLITWDPTQPIATRPLAIHQDGTWYTYGWDLTKNICEVFGSNGHIGTIYTYTPYGEVTSSGSAAQPLQWSSEFNDTELGLVYYNYRHYNSKDGKWLGRDNEKYSINLYEYCKSNPAIFIDKYGLYIDHQYPKNVVDYISKIGKDLKKYGRGMGLTDNDIIATGMAIAEEYSARDEYFGFKEIIDEFQDWLCRKEFKYVFIPGSDFGKGNINENTARDVNLKPLEKINKELKTRYEKTLKVETKARALIECDEGTTVLSILIMIKTVQGTQKYTDGLPEEEKAQVNVNAWREGTKILERMEENKQKLKDPSEYKPSSGMDENLVKQNYNAIKKALGM